MQFRFALRQKDCNMPLRGSHFLSENPMPEDAGQRHLRASHCVQQAQEAIKMADDAKSLELRQELLALAMSWLKLAHELDQTRN